MEGRSTYAAAYAIVLAIIGPLISVTASPLDTAALPPDEQYEKVFFDYLRPALLKANAACRVYYVVPCNNTDHDFRVPFPNVRVQQSSTQDGVLKSVREIFSSDKQVIVSQKADGIISVNIGQMPRTILQTKIPLLKLKPYEQYDPAWAVMALTGGKVVQAEMRKLGLEQATTTFSLPLNLPTKPAPHLPTVIKNITLDQALDVVAKTFRVAVVFGQCTSGSGHDFMRAYTVDLHAGDVSSKN